MDCLSDRSPILTLSKDDYDRSNQKIQLELKFLKEKQNGKKSNKEIKPIQKALKNFPKLVKQNEKRGASFRKLVEDFAPTKRRLAALARKKTAQIFYTNPKTSTCQHKGIAERLTMNWPSNPVANTL